VKTVKGLFARLCDADHLEHAMRLTTRGKRRRPDVAWFLLHAEARMAEIREALVSGRWRAAPFDVIRLRDPKPRAIARALIEDRVVHAALAMLIDEAWEPRLMPENMACRRGFGTHRARLALQRAMRRHRFFVHLDIRAYFPSLSVEMVRGLLRRRIRDEAFLGVVDQVLDTGAGMVDRPGLREFLGLPGDWPPRGRGLPVGAYTSQVIATHVVLDDLDHVVKRDWKVPGFLRYVDDVFLFGDRRRDLERWRSAVGAWLHDERDLRLKHPNARVIPTSSPLYGLGARITRDDIGPGPKILRRLAKRVRRELHGPGDRRAFERSLVATLGSMSGL